MADVDDQNSRRYAPNLQGLLRFCTENTKAEDAIGSSFQPMSDERKLWLKNALEAITTNDPVKKMMEHLQVIMRGSYGNESNDSSLKEKENSLEELALYCEDIDLANDFHKIGGFEIFPPMLNSLHASLKWRTADLLATLVQNNAYCQDKVLESATLMADLLEKLNSENEDADVQIKCLYAVSCLTREYEKGQIELIKLQGLQVLVKLLHSNVEKLQIKSIFLINSLCIESNKIKDLLLGMNIMDHLVELFKSQPHRPIHEHVTKTLINLAQNDESAKKQLKDVKYNLRPTLEERIHSLRDDQELEDEVKDLKLLMKICFG